MLSGLQRRLSVVGCAGVLVVLLIAMFVPGAYASQRAGVTRAVPSDTRRPVRVRVGARRLRSGRQRPGLHGGRPGDAHAVCHERL